MSSPISSYIALSLTEANNLAGSLPNELRALTALQTLDMYNNSLAGTIPTIVNEFTDLRILDVEQNQLSGPAFVDVSSLTDLQSYRVSLIIHWPIDRALVSDSVQQSLYRNSSLRIVATDAIGTIATAAQRLCVHDTVGSVPTDALE
jgi:hypothetical protein